MQTPHVQKCNYRIKQIGKTDRVASLPSIFRAWSDIVFVSTMYVNHPFFDPNQNERIYLSLSHVGRPASHDREGEKASQIRGVNLRTVGNYNFRIPRVSISFLRSDFYSLSPFVSRGGWKIRRPRYVEFFNKNHASVCAK